MGRNRKVFEGYTGKLLCNEESTKDFCKIALVCAESLSNKYFSVRDRFSPDDIVQEVLLNVYLKNIDFDNSKGKSLVNFINMLVERQYIDFLRYLEGKKRKCESEISLNFRVSDYNKDSHIESDYYGLIGEDDKGLDVVENEIDLEDFLGLVKDFCDDKIKVNGKSIGVYEIICMKLDGLSYTDMSLVLGVKSKNIYELISKNKKFLCRLYEDYFGKKLNLE